MTQSISQIIKFIIMGSLAALVHGIVLYLCVSQLLIAPVWANIVAFGVAFIVSFLGHSWVTFRQNIDLSDNINNIRRLGRWLSTSILGFMMNQGLFMLGLSVVGDAYYLAIWLIVTFIVTILSFTIGKLWAFKH